MNRQPVWRLRSLYGLLERRLSNEQRKRQPNAFTIQALKRRQLQVRDAIARAG